MKYFNQRVYYNKDLYQVGGVDGGRCMITYNKKWHVKDKSLYDFDAVSLYPSAMSRAYTVKGKPKVQPTDKLNIDYLFMHNAYVVEIRIKKVFKHYAFTLIVKKTKEGNLNNDNIKEG